MKRWLNSVAKGIDWLSRGVGFAAAYMLLGLMAFVFVNVALRYTISKPIKANDEISAYLFTFVVSMGLAYALKAGAHVRTTLVTGRLPSYIKRILELSTYIIGVSFAIIWTYSMWHLAIRDYIRGITSYSALEVPMWIPESVAAIGFTVFLFLMVSQLFRLKIK